MRPGQRPAESVGLQFPTCKQWLHGAGHVRITTALFRTPRSSPGRRQHMHLISVPPGPDSIKYSVAGGIRFTYRMGLSPGLKRCEIFAREHLLGTVWLWLIHVTPKSWAHSTWISDCKEIRVHYAAHLSKNVIRHPSQWLGDIINRIHNGHGGKNLSESMIPLEITEAERNSKNWWMCIKRDSISLAILWWQIKNKNEILLLIHNIGPEEKGRWKIPSVHQCWEHVPLIMRDVWQNL